MLREDVMKKAILFLTVLMALPAILKAESFEIDRFGSSIVIEKNGNVTVNEKIDVTFSEMRHGIYRTIPFISVVNNRRYSVRISGFTANAAMKVTREGNYYKIRLGDANSYVDGQQTYNIGYKLQKIILTDNTNYDEFYWNVTGNEWETTIYSTHFEIELPVTIQIGENVDYRIYAGSTGSTTVIATSGDQSLVSAPETSQTQNTAAPTRAARRRASSSTTVSDVSVTVDGNILIVDIPLTLSSYEGITIQLRMKKGIMEISKVLQFWYALTDFIQRFIHFILAIILFVISFFIWLKWGKDQKVPIMTEFLPPKDISPSDANSILKQNAAFDLSSTLVDLAVRGYIVIGEEKHKVYLEQLKQPDSGTKEYERKLLDYLFSGSFSDSKIQNRVYTSSLEDSFYTYYNTVKNEFDSQFNRGNYFEHEGNAWRGIFVFFAFISVVAIFFGWMVFHDYMKLLVFSVLALINNIVFAVIMPRKTIKGLNYYRQILGFKEFISRAEKDRIKRLMDENPKYFDDTIPYAIVFGMAKKWGTLFDNIITEPPTWYRTDTWGAHGFRPSYLASSIYSNVNHISSSAVSQPSSSGSGSGGGWSGGGGSWGGSSGGGFGGGGGGSW